MARDLGLERETRGLAAEAAGWTAARVAWALGSALFVLAVPVVLILGPVRFAFSWQPVYTYAVTAYHGDDATGISTPVLLGATHRIRTYFTNGDRDLDITVADRTGRVGPLFNQREIAHMRDVKALVHRVYLLLDLGALWVGVFALAAVSLPRGDAPRRLAALALAGAGLTVAIVVAFGCAALAGFDQLFTEFHVLSFRNDFWELDPARDHLVQIFPLAFWFDVSLFVACLALAGALLLAALAGTVLLVLRRRSTASA